LITSNNPETGTVIPIQMGGLNQSVLRTTPSDNIELESHQFSEEVIVNGPELWKMRISFPRGRPINIWDYGSLNWLNKIFESNFDHDYREKYYSSVEHPKIFMLEAMRIQVTLIAIFSSFVREYPEDSLSDLGFSVELHFWSICKTESLFATN
jgi:hypothetical protein